jgi:hypothetical protein
MLRLVDLIRITADAVRVRKIARGGVQSHRLRAHAAAGNVEDFEGAHAWSCDEVMT